MIWRASGVSRFPPRDQPGRQLDYGIPRSATWCHINGAMMNQRISEGKSRDGDRSHHEMTGPSDGLPVTNGTLLCEKIGSITP